MGASPLSEDVTPRLVGMMDGVEIFRTEEDVDVVETNATLEAEEYWKLCVRHSAIAVAAAVENLMVNL